ncbi:L,D-transpeptidase family protein [Flexithrix dorotheae]|uniref:L,D-transpeptidase family protein n=1 Tax=Flexithrix dorotheae TaxID=70993 RepID=UPI000365F7C8|nr:L,D-transpeptidase family protein [Flexithrix dorotheae]
MKTTFFVFIFFQFLINPGSDFKTDQMRYPRVREAYRDCAKTIEQNLSDKGFTISNFQIFIRAFKREGILEVWGKRKEDQKFQFIKDYKICKASGEAGPKRKSGDYQVPEGFYYIDRFNPNSTFHLSLGINYPNQSDKILGNQENPGGDIFIHGNCVTIGCLPITDAKIKELYVMAVEARNNGQQKIPVHIFPTILNEPGMEWLDDQNSFFNSKMNFWNNLQPAFKHFEKNKTLPKIKVKNNGEYFLD